jgi:hypothetical protein
MISKKTKGVIDNPMRYCRKNNINVLRKHESVNVCGNIAMTGRQKKQACKKVT